MQMYGNSTSFNRYNVCIKYIFIYFINYIYLQYQLLQIHHTVQQCCNAIYFKQSDAILLDSVFILINTLLIINLIYIIKNLIET